MLEQPFVFLNDTTSFRQPSIGKPSFHQPSIGQLNNKVSIHQPVDWATCQLVNQSIRQLSLKIRQFVNLV